MSIWTHITEALSAIGDSIGSFLTTLASRTPTPPEKSLAFTIGMIGLGAKMAKADGLVTGEEVKAFKKIFQVPPEEENSVARVFNLAKQDVAGYETYARQIAKLFHPRADILEDVLDGLFFIALVDRELHSAELSYLRHVAQIFGFDAEDFARIRSRHVDTATEDHYAILGVMPTADVATIKARYRELVRLNHPDRHMAAGMPEEMIMLATNRLAAINAAYDKISVERGL